VALGNDAESIVTDLGTTRARVAVAALSPSSSAEAFAHCLDETRPRAIMINDQYKGEWRTEFLRKLIPELWEIEPGDLLKPARWPFLRTVVHTGMDYSPGFVQFRDIYIKNPLLDPLGTIIPSPTDVAFVVPANGQWQGIIQEDAVSAAQSFASGVGLTRDDRVSMNLALSSLSGKVAGVLGLMSNLSVIIIPAQDFSSAKTIATLDQEVATTLLVTTHQLRAILEDSTNKKFERLEKLIVVADDGHTPSADLLTKAKGAWGLRDIRVAVGSPSAVPFLVSGSGDPTKLKPVSNTQIKVVDDQGKEVNKGVSGHLVVKGPAVMSTRWVRGEAQVLGEWRDSGLRGATAADGTVTVC